MKYFDIAWDFDGTLYNSYPYIIVNATETLRAFGVEPDPEELEKLCHDALGVTFRHYAPLCGCTPDDLRSLYLENVRAGGCSSLVSPYPGIAGLLADIVRAGGRNHICSHRGLDGCKSFLARDGLAGYFDCFVCPDSPGGLRFKPAPDYICHLMEQRGIAPEGLIMVGDRNLDIEAAHAAGCAGCFFDPDGFATVTCNPEFIAPDMEALRKVLLG